MPRPLGLSLLLLVTTIGAGLAIRFARLGLPPFLVKYGGSFLWALLLYWLGSTLLPRSRIPVVAAIVACGAAAVEFFKRVHTPALDAFRLTLPGILLLGRFFAVQDLLAYGLAILAGACLDRALRRRAATSTLAAEEP